MKIYFAMLIGLTALSCASEDPKPNINTAATAKVQVSDKVYFYNVVASPTDEESVTLKNGLDTNIDASNWTIGDLNNPDAYKIPGNTIIDKGSTLKFPKTTINFQINDKEETLYLKDASGNLIDTWRN